MPPHTTTRSRQGSALVVSLFTLASLAALGAAFLTISTSTARRQAGENNNLQAFYLAEAGLAEAMQAVRMGRSGQIGSETMPASFGDGLLWVDASNTVDEQVRLECTALYGRGRASLALVVEPVEIPLGFFGDEEVVVESVLLVDGYDSEEAAYAEVAIEPEIDEDLTALQALYQALIAGPGSIVIHDYLEGHKHLADKIHEEGLEYAAEDKHFRKLADVAEISPYALAAQWLDLVAAYEQGQLGSTGEVPLTVESSPAPQESGSSKGAGEGSVPALSVAHTESGGLLSSNGNIAFSTTSGDAVAIFGDVRPGPDGSISGIDGIHVSGSTESRGSAVDLPEVTVPDVVLGAPLVHSSPMPGLLSGGTTGYSRLEVTADAEFVIVGPATVVIGDLVLTDGASLTLDTRVGDVALYVTEGMDLQPGSIVETTGEQPDELTVQVAAIPTLTSAPVQLHSTSDFHGTIYAPDADVYIGSEFEVFGGVVARRLEIGSGARLHFDNAGYDDSSPIPRIVSWKVEEIPQAVRGRGLNPFTLLGVDPEAVPCLAEAHDLESVELSIVYEDSVGAQRTYDGKESDFDWEDVEEIVILDRDPTRKEEDPSRVRDVGDPGDVEGTGTSTEIGTGTETQTETFDAPRDEVITAMSTMDSRDLKTWLQGKTPLSESELMYMLETDPVGGKDQRDMLVASGHFDDEILIKLLEVDPMSSEHHTDVLMAAGPLSDAVLEKLVQSTHGIDSADLKQILVANSPLPDHVYTDVMASGKLEPTDRTSLENANK